MLQNGIVNRVRKTVAEFLDPPAQIRIVASNPHPKIETKHSQDKEEDAFFSRLEKIIGANSGTAQTGRVNVIGLDNIKLRLGSRWAELHDRVEAVARGAIERCLWPEDTYALHNGNFIIVFGGLDIEAAQTKCILIAKMIEETLFGEHPDIKLCVTTAVTTVDGTLAFESLPTLDAVIRSQLPHATVHRRFRREDKTAHAETVAKTSLVTRQAEILWRPVWDARSNVIPIYRPELTYDAPLLDESRMIEDDLMLCGAVAGALKECLAASRFLLFVLPVHFATIATAAGRNRYSQELSRVITPEMQKLLLTCLTDIPSGVPSSRMIDLTGVLRPHCRQVSARLPIETTDFNALKGCSFFAVGADIANSLEPERKLFTLMEQFRRTADRAAFCNFFLDGVRTMPVVTAAVAEGFCYLSGNAIAKPMAHIMGARNFTLGDVYRVTEPKGGASTAPPFAE